MPLNCVIVIPFNISFLSGRLAAPSLLRKSILRKAFDCGTLDMAIDFCVYTNKHHLYIPRIVYSIIGVTGKKPIILHKN